jgi:hypothetical protein
LDLLRSQLSATLRLAVGGATVSAERATFIGEFGALLATDNVPVSLAALFGLKSTV